MNDTQTQTPVTDPNCRCVSGPHLACPKLQAWWETGYPAGYQTQGWHLGQLVPNGPDAPCPGCGQPCEAHCASLGTRRYQLRLPNGVLGSHCDRAAAERVARDWEGSEVVDQEVGPDLTALALGDLTRLVAPGGEQQQHLNQAVLAELVRRNAK